MKSRRIAYLTMDDEAGWQIDSELAFAPLAALGWQVEAVRWRSADVDWSEFDAVYIGTPWDYPQDPQRFIRVLEEIDRSPAVLVNDIALVRWTLSKTYLRDLEQRGIRIVPSIWGNEISASQLRAAFDQFGAARIIVKPVISTNATDTFLLSRDSLTDRAQDIAATFAARSFVVQPFIDSIRTEGEYSLFYFNGEFSHAICKTPTAGDFRVQEEFGGDIVPVEPAPQILEAGATVMQCVAPRPVYARCDFVRGTDGHFLLMELELIEPSLYLRMDERAPRRFAEAFDAYVETCVGET